MENGNDLISRQAATEMKLIDGEKLIADLRRYGHETISIDGLEGLIATQPEIIRCKDCKYMIDTGDDLMCDNEKGWVVATASDFGCVLAERRTDE